MSALVVAWILYNTALMCANKLCDRNCDVLAVGKSKFFYT